MQEMVLDLNMKGGDLCTSGITELGCEKGRGCPLVARMGDSLSCVYVNTLVRCVDIS